jgi:dihydroorotate dehydrogenase
LITAVQEINKKQPSEKPILLKIAPDLNNHQLDDIIELVAETAIDGVIASNTSTTRDHLKATPADLRKIGNGGVSGQPIKEQSTKVIKYLAETSQNAFPIIGVGGIHSAQDALDKIAAGADLVQIYTGFIYEGPRLIKQINKGILENLKIKKFKY